MLQRVFELWPCLIFQGYLEDNAYIASLGTYKPRGLNIQYAFPVYFNWTGLSVLEIHISQTRFIKNVKGRTFSLSQLHTDISFKYKKKMAKTFEVWSTRVSNTLRLRF